MRADLSGLLLNRPLTSVQWRALLGRRLLVVETYAGAAGLPREVSVAEVSPSGLYVCLQESGGQRNWRTIEAMQGMAMELLPPWPPVLYGADRTPTV